MSDVRTPPVDGSRLVGVFGVGRNGSTLLMRLLDGAPGLWMYPIELNFGSVLQLASGYADPDDGFDAWVDLQARELAETYLDHLAEPLDAAVDVPAAASDTRGEGLAARMVAYLEAVRGAFGSDVTDTGALLAFKSIEAAELDRYERLFPGLRLVHLVRDPFTAYASLKRTDLLVKRKPFWFQGDLLRTFLERRWLPHAELALDRVAADPDRNLLVTYEELVREPEGTVGRICDWLGIEPPAEPALQTVLGGRVMRELPINASKPGVETPAQVVPDMAARYGYEDVLSSRERDFIAFRSAGLAVRLGYEPPPNGTSRARLAGEWILPDRWELMNVRSPLRFGRALARRRAYILGTLLRG